MPVKVYVDSNIFISIILDEISRDYQLLGLRSLEFLNECLECKYEVYVSDFVLDEFCRITSLNDEDFNDLFSVNPKKVRVVESCEEDIVRASQLGKVYVNGFLDSMHASLAIKAKCDFICTWNVKDFVKLEERGVIKVRKPDEL